MRIVGIQGNGNLFKEIVNADGLPKVKKEFLLNAHETLLKGKVLNESESLAFYQSLEEIHVRFYWHPDESEENVILETEEVECDNCSIAKTRLERLEEIFEKTISSRSELKKAYHEWALKNHPDKFPPSRQKEANRRFQEVTSLLE
ncbi:MAG: hypothetical protein CK425_03185 [Parachlamydia sp.]|nr:MAG: hypothetical protein CK425_03185 [Parachlamydia sp.]